MQADRQKKLLKRAGTLIARRAHSRGELRLKLCKFEEEPHVEAVLSRLEELNLLNDADYAYNFAFRRIEQDGWGPLKVRNHLTRRQVAEHHIDEALDRVRTEISDKTALRAYLERYRRNRGMPVDGKGVRRLIMNLARRGFREETIRSVLRREIPGDVWDACDTGD